jgi:hypothetical protein
VSGKKHKKIVLEKAGADLKDFQAKYSDVWKKIVDSPAYRAGVQFLRNKKLDTILNLSDDAIEKNGREIAADLRGFLQFENELLTLPEMPDFSLPFEEPDEYRSPEQIAEMEQLQSKFREETKRQRYA